MYRSEGYILVRSTTHASYNYINFAGMSQQLNRASSIWIHTLEILLDRSTSVGDNCCFRLEMKASAKTDKHLYTFKTICKRQSSISHYTHNLGRSLLNNPHCSVTKLSLVLALHNMLWNTLVWSPVIAHVRCVYHVHVFEMPNWERWIDHEFEVYIHIWTVTESTITDDPCSE